MPEPRDVRAFVRAAVEAAGLPVSEEEYEEIVVNYPALRADADRLYIEAARYETPAQIFSPVSPTDRN